MATRTSFGTGDSSPESPFLDRRDSPDLGDDLAELVDNFDHIHLNTHKVFLIVCKPIYNVCLIIFNKCNFFRKVLLWDLHLHLIQKNPK